MRELDFEGDSDAMSSGSSRWDAGTDDHLIDRELTSEENSLTSDRTDDKLRPNGLQQMQEQSAILGDARKRGGVHA